MNSPYMGRFEVTQQYKGLPHDGLDLKGIDSKEIHSTINGVVEYAGWENPNDRKQGFGLYVRILKDGTNDRYYFGHLSETRVKVGQHVKVTDVIGIEGSTGKSTGSHCHYCCRTNRDKNLHKDISAISGIPNKLGTYDDGHRPGVTQPAPPVTKKLYLPASATSWRVYPTNKAPVKGNECGYLNPAKFGGLTYDIIGNPQPDVYTIKTANFGVVNIFAGTSTGAVIK